MATGDLIDLEAALARLGVSGGDKEPIIARLITVASDLCKKELGVDILTASYTETRDGTNGAAMPLRQEPITAVTSVVVNGVAIPQASPAATGSGWYYEGRYVYLRGYVFTRGNANVVITYTAGYSAVPEIVKEACFLTLQALYESPDLSPNISSEMVPGVGTVSCVAERDVGTLPAAAQKLLWLSGLKRTFAV